VRPGRVASPRSTSPAFTALLLIFGFLLAVGLVQERLREKELPTRAAELRALIGQRRDALQQLTEDVRRLSERLSGLQGSVADESGDLQALLDRVERLRAAAGLEAMAGPGIVVELQDSPRVPTSSAEEADLRIQDTDLRLVVNALWQAGAEAVAVNGQRVVSTTAIRRAGQAVLVNYRGVASPYRVVALGDGDALQEGLARAGIVGQFEVWREVYGLGFTVRPAGRLMTPALAAPQEVRWATPAEEGTE
jgi:uncharacterized protein YlxW (UPF0749 family)